jgi:hypothetical protein
MELARAEHEVHRRIEEWRAGDERVVFAELAREPTTDKRQLRTKGGMESERAMPIGVSFRRLTRR